MKTLANVLVGTFLLFLGTLLFNVEVNPLIIDESLPQYANVFITLIMSSLVAAVVGLLEVVPVLLIIGGLALVFAHFTDDGTIAFYIAVLCILPIVWLGHAWVIDSLVQPRIWWFPNFSYWQFVAIFFVSSCLSISSVSSSKKSE